MPKNYSRDLKNLRGHNTNGAKETIIRQTKDGSMVGEKRKECDTPSSPTRNLQSNQKLPAEGSMEDFLTAHLQTSLGTQSQWSVGNGLHRGEHLCQVVC